ncbi:histidine--tRNA ligase [Sediminibacterium soli]|uniref:histidine--tRNA ligase n=1 Tax=Sediminibacterium soli TaxID=2698829 RepID=UPI00137B0A50|nr:histidine--tRNA ligase [Sediminibacterium soli]NCI47468.1 histidine--tRNA ligase [Sediminibacterium soli]
MNKPGLPQGTRDFSAVVVRKRNHIFTTIRSVFELYGFQPLETPAMENLDTLMGKYGEEGDKLIFKILNNGLDNPAKEQQAKEAFSKILSGKSSRDITERALRYDLTIPFARYVAMNFGQLTLPFKRYQVQPVWRADRPQKGRYREFYQCDADVVGSRSLLNEVELAYIYSQVFSKLRVPVTIHINSRKVLAALAEICGGEDKMMDITIAIDKLDKIGLEKVKEELSGKGLNSGQVAVIDQYLSIGGDETEKMTQLKTLLGGNASGLQGIAEIQYVLDRCRSLPAGSRLQTDFTLARGLNYYTGIIFEVKANGVQMGSIGGGGRYDDLTGLFGVPDVPGVGISFGVDRIYDVMEELQVFPDDVAAGTRVLFFNLGQTESEKAFALMQQLREKQVACELYHEQAKFDKQFRYADKKQIPFTVIIGSKEAENGTCVVKNLASGEQHTIAQAVLPDFSFQ